MASTRTGRSAPTGDAVTVNDGTIPAPPEGEEVWRGVCALPGADGGECFVAIARTARGHFPWRWSSSAQRWSVVTHDDKTRAVLAAWALDAEARVGKVEAVAEGRERAAFSRGVVAAASVADQYNASSTHPYRLGDCILTKLNQTDRRPRPNEHRGG